MPPVGLATGRVWGHEETVANARRLTEVRSLPLLFRLMPEISIPALDAGRLQRRLRSGKSLAFENVAERFLVRFSGVFPPLTDVRERLVGRSET